VNLRERRKIETLQLIQRTAFELARHADLDTISVDTICQRAGLSQRTFFNYFPYKEAAFVLLPPSFPAEAVARFLEARGPLLDGLVDLLVAQALTVAPERWMVDVSRRIVEDHPKIAALQFSQFHQFEYSFAELIASRLELKTPDTLCLMVSAALLGAVRVILDKNRGAAPQKIAASMKRELPRLSALMSQAADSGNVPKHRSRRPEMASK
jgi:AcrR family transcriptional regulator